MFIVIGFPIGNVASCCSYVNLNNKTHLFFQHILFFQVASGWQIISSYGTVI